MKNVQLITRKNSIIVNLPLMFQSGFLTLENPFWTTLRHLTRITPVNPGLTAALHVCVYVESWASL